MQGVCFGSQTFFIRRNHDRLQLVELRRSEGWISFALAAATNDFCHLESLLDTAIRSTTVHVRLFMHECHIVLPASSQRLWERGVIVESSCLPLVWFPCVNWPQGQ